MSPEPPSAARGRSGARARARFDSLLGPLSGRRLPTWVLGVLVALLSWKVQFGVTRPGLDPSWGAGLYMATRDGLEYGRDVVFTYGPLGFLSNPVGWDGDLAALAFGFQVALDVALACSLVWVLRRSLGGIGAALVAFGALALLPGVEQALVLAAIWCYAVLLSERPRFAPEVVIIGGASLAAVEFLVKLSIGPVVLALGLLALIGARARRRQLALYLGLFGLEVVLLWLMSGQALGALPDYLLNGRHIVSGYSEAMVGNIDSTAEYTAGVVVALVALAGLVVGAALPSYRGDLARWCAIGIAALAGFAVFKEGIVRFGVDRLIVYFSTLSLLWLAIPWSAARRLILLGGAAVLVAATLVLSHARQPGQTLDRLNAAEHVQLAGTQVRDLLSPDRRSQVSDFSRAYLQGFYGLDEVTLSELSGRSVAIDPWEITVAWAYELDWAPLPVFQNYSAYTEELDRLNAAEVSSGSGPERILRHNPAQFQPGPEQRSIDNRFPGWDPPAQALATLCNFVPLHTTVRWQVLGRTADRCAEPEPMGSAQASFGETVDVPSPAAGEVVFARIDGADVGAVETLRALLFRAKPRYAVVNGTATYRLVPGTAGDGLLLRGSPTLTGAGPWAQAPQAETLELTGVDGELRFDFYRMAVDPIPASAAGP